jgi:hypothetical protein
LRDAALHALCDTRDGALLPDLLKVAGNAADGKTRLLAIRGAVRLTTQEEGVKLSNEQKLATLQAILDKPLDASEKRLVLSGLGAIPDSQSLNLAATMLDDVSVKAEAARAVIQIADALPPVNASEAVATLTKIITENADAATTASAEEARKKAWRMSSFVTLWQIAGPYQQQGKDFSALFDIAFPPETGDAASVHWREMPTNSNPADSWKMDLLQALGGEQRVAYARTWIHSPKQQSARLELGADDGVKVWLNGVLVHANNTSRSLQPGSDQVDVTLNEGWNALMLKITQNTGGWEFCARLAQPSGEPVDGLRVSVDPDAAGR